jgi:hypothetical protein
MGKRLAVRLLAPVACAFIVIGCGGGDEPRPQRPVATADGEMGREGRDEHLPAGSTVSLTGCVEGAPAAQQFVLRNVRFESQEGVDPQRDTSTPGPGGITEGSWVRLDGSEQAQALQGFLGQRVTLTGTIADTGESTIGTAGTTGGQTPAGATTRAAGDEHYSERMKDEAGRIARESMADGTAALVHVTSVEGTGERCPTDLRPEVR